MCLFVCITQVLLLVGSHVYTVQEYSESVVAIKESAVERNQRQRKSFDPTEKRIDSNGSSMGRILQTQTMYLIVDHLR